jgi:hypothetical protein
MNDEDKKMIEEAEKLDREATPGPWVVQPVITLAGPNARLAVRSRELLPALAKRLREALDHTELDRYLDHVEADAEALSLASSAGFETARREAIEAIQNLPAWPVVNAEAERRKEVDRVKAAYPVQDEEDLDGYVERVARAERAKKTAVLSPELVEQLREASVEATPLPREHSAVFCEHANEVPSTCPCEAGCYCKSHTCRWGSPGAPPPKDLPEMTAEQRVEQRIEQAFNRLLPSPHPEVCHRVAEAQCYKEAFEEVLEDLRTAVKALQIIEGNGTLGSSRIAFDANLAIKTKGLLPAFQGPYWRSPRLPGTLMRHFHWKRTRSSFPGTGVVLSNGSPASPPGTCCACLGRMLEQAS